MNLEFPLTHNGVTYSAAIYKIESTKFGVEDHGILTAYLHCKGDGCGISVGGYSLDGPQRDESGSHRVGSAFGTEWLMRVMATVGVESWEKLPGSRLLILFPKAGHWGLQAVGIANIDTAKPLIFTELAAEFFPEAGGE